MLSKGRMIHRVLVPILLCTIVHPAECRSLYSRIELHEMAFMKEGDTYYMLTNENGITLRSSEDLQTWKDCPKVFNETQKNGWMDGNIDFVHVHDLKKINQTYLMYIQVEIDLTYCLGVASAESILGPYTVTESPIICKDSHSFVSHPQVCVNDGQPVLFYAYRYRFNNGIKAMNLSKDGLNSTSEEFIIIRASGELMDPGCYNPRVIQNNGYFYLFYNHNDGVYVARSLEILGPYEKRTSKFVPFPANIEKGRDDLVRIISSFVKDSDDTFRFVMVLFSPNWGVNGTYDYNMAAKKLKFESNWPVIID